MSVVWPAFLLLLFGAAVGSLEYGAEHTTTLTAASAEDFGLKGGASFTRNKLGSYDIRTGGPGQHSTAVFPMKMMLAPGTSVTSIAFSYRYLCGYGHDGKEVGANFTLKVAGHPVYYSPHYTDHSYDSNHTNYSSPVQVNVTGLSLTMPSSFPWPRLEIDIDNNNRNLQIMAPWNVEIACQGSQPCAVPAPPPPPPPAPPPKGVTGPWEAVGPWNIGDDIDGQGEAGTLADAASPASNPNLIYGGGQNNGASSGVWKTVDMGLHWTLASNGLFNTRIECLGIVDDKGDHVLVGVQGGLYETTDAAASWKLIPESVHFGTCNTIKNGTINGEPHMLASCSAGVANVPRKGGNWSIIPVGGFSRTYMSVSDSLQTNSVVGGCLGGRVTIGTILSKTAANWTSFPDRPCSMLALDPNNAEQFIYTKPPMTYHSKDGGKTYESLNHSCIFHCHIDRQGWFYTASECGAFRSMDQGHSWQSYYDVRHQRRTGKNASRVPHDYQRISGDFAGGVAFPSDQGLFIKPPGNATELIKANGNLSNAIALSPAVSYGDGPGKHYIVTAMWDWGPVASWDSGVHWPSWQTPEDGMSGACIGEGGGAYAMGKSNHMLLMHHHNALYSSHGGKNMTRFVMPGGATFFGPTYARKPGSRSEPNGAVFSPLFMGPMPWNQLPDKALPNCSADEYLGDLGIHTNFSCLAAVDLGVSYGWYKAVTYAVWRGDTDKHCYICNVSGNSSLWNYTDYKGAYSYVKQGTGSNSALNDMLKKYDMNKDGMVDQADLQKAAEKYDTDQEDDGEDDAKDADHNPLTQNGGIASSRSVTYIAKNFNYGYGNWTWSQLPDFLQGIRGFVTGLTDENGKYTIYGVSSNCITQSFDQGDTWEPCWWNKNLTGSIGSLVIKDLKTMLVLRNGDVPLRTKDGGETWQPLTSLSLVAAWSHGAAWSWSGKTLVVAGRGGDQNMTWHPHAGYVWMSKDDGDTWTDETDDLVTMAGGISQWYENDLYMGSSGNGIFKKTMEGEEPTEVVLI